MKSTETFKRTIKAYLDHRAEQDSLFAAVLEKPKKNIDDCVTYILNQVQAAKVNGYSDDEIYSMAVHYYDEDDIDVGKATNMSVVVNHQVVLTEEEKAEAKAKALKRLEDEAYAKLKKKPSKTKKEEVGPDKSLF